MSFRSSAEEYVFTYLKSFPENTFALPPTFRKVVRGLNASHWLAKKVIEMKDRRWRLRQGHESEYGRMSAEEVEKIKQCNPAFWELYINRRPPTEILNKKRTQYERKCENNKNSRSNKKTKIEGDENEGNPNDQTVETAKVPLAMDEEVVAATDPREVADSNPAPPPHDPVEAIVGDAMDGVVVDV